MTGELAVDRFDPTDAVRVRELHHEAFRDAPEYVPDAPDEDLTDVEGHYLDRGGEFLVGRVDGRIVAMGAALPADVEEPIARYGDVAEHPGLAGAPTPVALLKRLRVAPAARRNGYGSQITDALFEWAREEGFRSVALDTGAANDVARGFSEAHGFECVDERTIDFGPMAQKLAFYRKRIAD